MDFTAQRSVRVRRVLGAAALALATGAATLGLAVPATAAPAPVVGAPTPLPLVGTPAPLSAAGKAAAAPAGVTAEAGQRFVPVTPARLLDTRKPGFSPLYNSHPQILKIAGNGGVPLTGVKSVVLNVTVTETHSPAF